MNLLQLKYFQEIARYSNISRAAEALHVSQPSLSTSIKRLETELGIELFDRRGKSITLNDYGKIFLKDINSVFALLYQYRNEQTILDTNASKCINIGGTKSELVLAPYIINFSRKHPDILISMQNAVNVSMLDPSILDFVLYSDKMANIPKKKIIVAKDRHSLLLSREHPLANNKKVTLDMLRNELFVMCAPNRKLLDPGYRLCRAMGFEPKVACVTDERVTLLSMIKNLHYVSVVPEYDAKFFSTFGDFVLYPIDREMADDIVLTIPNDEREITRCAKLFIRELFEYEEIQILNPDLDVDSF